MNQHYIYKALVLLLKSLQGPELQVGIVYLTYDSDWVKFSEKNVYVIFYQTALMNFQRVTEEGFFFCLLEDYYSQTPKGLGSNFI